MSQAGNPFSSSPPTCMCGGVMQHSLDEHHLSQDAVTPAQCDAHSEDVLSHSQLRESRLPFASLTQGSADGGVRTAMLSADFNFSLEL